MGFMGRKLIAKEKPFRAGASNGFNKQTRQAPFFSCFFKPPNGAIGLPLFKATFGGGKAGRFATVAKLRANENPCAVVIPANLRNVPAALSVSGAEVTDAHGQA